MSLANKYRPDTFDKIIGQDHITHILKAQMKNEQRNNHNYLLFGPRGTGKTTAARILSKAINCLDLQDGNPCNQCANCSTINKGQTFDYVEIDAASYTGVDNIREEILDKVPYPPTQLKKKIYVIDEVHMLSKSAFNALLKTIEEPNSAVGFIFATTEIHKVPETIVSRCQVFNFKKVLKEVMTPHLKNICNSEGLSFEEEALDLISDISEGCVRDAVKYVDQISVFGSINMENVNNFLGIAGEAMIKDFLELIKSKNREAIFKKVDEIHDQGIDLLQFAKQNIMYIDKNIMSDIDFFISVSEIFSEIIATARHYPYPTMLYKIAINKFLGQNSQIINYQEPIKQENKIQENKAEDNIIVETPISEEKNQNEAPNAESKEKEILNQLIEKVESKTLKDSLRDHTFIKNISDGKAYFVVINKIAEIALNRDDTKSNLEEMISEIVGENITIDIQFQSKEDYFSSIL
ncbi:MAG TPA: DNA polymerase III subunit gamma/tau [Candidatus Absconditabacterales bacterium]|nr:DNA polymerase III subunit gamma/tau [Candidatus Absconditabacterales bacterium]